MRATATILALSPLLALAFAGPIAKRSITNPPYFQISGFFFTRDSQTSSYNLTIRFPIDVSVSNTPANDPVYVVPGFTDTVVCSGTYTFGGRRDASHITTINTCTHPSHPRKSIGTQLDVVTGELLLTYIFNGTSTNGPEHLFTYTGSQKDLTPVGQANAIDFKTVATSGPGIDQ